MSEPSDKRSKGGRGFAAAQAERRKQGYALHTLNAISAKVSPDARDVVERDDAIRELAATIRGERLAVPRLRVLDTIVKLARRRPDAVDAAAPLVEALVAARVPARERPTAVATVRSALGSVAELAAAPKAETRSFAAWPVFVGTQQLPGVDSPPDVESALRLDAAEVDKPLCNDTEEFDKDGHKAKGVTCSFFTDAAPKDMTVCDPTRWHEATTCFDEMQPWTGPGAVDEGRPNGGWRRDLIETLYISPSLKFDTPLRFTYSIDRGPDPRWVHLDYVLIGGKTRDIAVDEGAIDLRRVTAGDHAGRTRVSTKKLISFRDEDLANWPTIACDTFWPDLVINAAVGSLRSGGPEKDPIPGALKRRGEPAMTDSKLSAAINEAANAANQSINAYTDLAKQAAGYLTGAERFETADWLQLTAKGYSRAIGDVTTAWNRYNDLLKALGDSEDQARGGTGGEANETAKG